MSRSRIWSLVSAVAALAILAGDGLAAPAQTLSEAYSRTATWQSAPVPVQAGGFRTPWGIDVGADGTIYVADTRLHSVHVLNSDGTSRALFDGTKSATGQPAVIGDVRDVAVGDNVLYVSDPGANVIHVFALDGTYQRGFHVDDGPGGLAFADGRLYVTLQRVAEVQVFDAADQIVWSWDSQSAPLQRPWGIAVGKGRDTRVFIADLNARRILVFDRQGVLADGFDVRAGGVSSTALDVAVDDTGDLFAITDTHFLRYKDGVPVGETKMPGSLGVAIGPGQGVATTAQDYRLGFTGVRIFPDRRAQTMVPEVHGGPFAPLGNFERPRRVSANQDDRVFISDTWPRVQEWNTSGTPRTQFGSGALHDIAAGRRGSVYAIDGRTLTYWSDDGSVIYSWQPPSATPGAGDNPWAWLTSVDSLGNDAVVLDTGDQHAYLLDYSGNPLGDWPIAPADGFESVADLALGKDVVYLINRSTRRVDLRRRSDGAVLDRWSIPGGAVRIDAGLDESVYILNGSGWIWKRGADGVAKALWQVAPDRSATDIAAGNGGCVYVTYSDANNVGVFCPDPAGTPPAVPTFDDRCNLTPEKTASPTDIELGAAVDIELTVSGDCPLADAESDVILLVDTSGSMAGGKMDAARSAALEFVGQLDYGLNQVGLVSFSTDVALVQGLTKNPRALIKAIPSLGDDQGTNMLGAMNMADDEFASPRARPDARKVIILLTDGQPNTGAGEIVAIAARYREMGRAIYAIGLGLDVDRDFLKAVVTDPSYYFDAPSEYDLSRIYDNVARRVAASVLLQSAHIVDTLPTNMQWVAGSARPVASYNAAARTLSWDFNAVQSGGITLKYKVRPQEVGDWPTNVSAIADYKDGVRHEGQLVFPVPRVKVRPPKDIPPPTRYYAYLPAAYREKCQDVETDVVLAFDTSGSMNDASVPGGPSKLDAALQAGRVFLTQLHLPTDKVAIVAFNGSASVVQKLTGDQLTLVQAMKNLPRGTGTRIDLGLDAAVQALADHEANRLPVIVLLTDGNQTGSPSSDALAAGERARAAGITLFTIALGSDADQALLMAIAGQDRRFFNAPSEKELAAIYREVAALIPCER